VHRALVRLGSFLLKLARPNLKLRDHLGHFRKRNQRPYLLRLLAEKLGGWHMGTPLTGEHRSSQNRTDMSVGNKGQPSACVDLNQRHHPAFRLGIPGNVPLGGGEARVSREFLHIAQASAALDDLARRLGDEGPSPRVRARACEAQLMVQPAEPYLNRRRAVAVPAFAVDDAAIRRCLFSSIGFEGRTIPLNSALREALSGGCPHVS